MVRLGTYFFIIVLLVSACGDEAIRSAALWEEVLVKEGESVVVRDGVRHFQVSVSDIDDSRCPSNVDCVTAGKVVCDFLIGGKESIKLCLGECSNGSAFQEVDSAIFHLDERTYYLKLIDVTPYPVDPDHAEKAAIISVFK